jgi:hypothetical protein
MSVHILAARNHNALMLRYDDIATLIEGSVSERQHIEEDVSSIVLWHLYFWFILRAIQAQRGKLIILVARGLDRWITL